MKRTIANAPNSWRNNHVPQPRRRFSGDKKKKGKPKPKPGAKKPVAAKKEPEPEPVKERIQAPYKFLPEETAAMEKQLRGELSAIDTLEEQKKASAKDFALRMENKKNLVNQLRHRLDTGEETREMEVHVEFDVKRQKKQYLHPATRDFIREEDMTAADNQLPMFRQDGEPARHVPAAPVVPPKTSDELTLDAVKHVDDPEALKRCFVELRSYFPDAYKGNEKKAFATFSADVHDLANKSPEAGGNEEGGQGQTSVGAALDKAAAGAKCAPMDIDLTVPYDFSGLMATFKRAAKAAGWSQAQTNVLRDQMKTRDTVDGMIDTLRPHVKPASESDAPPM